MLNLSAMNVNDALIKGISLLQCVGVPVSPRGMATIEAIQPVTTSYLRPWQRVLLNPIRDANHFFHFFEALWILAGRADVAFLQQFNSNIATYSDDGETFHAPYGYRLRHAFGIDQFDAVVEQLKADPESRRAVMQIWHSGLDLNKDSKDLPCNDLIMCKIRDGKLQITVCNRSNDIIWGCYGANAVQFSVIQEYLAARLGVGIGVYRQVSDSYHAYTDNPQWKKLSVADIHPVDYDFEHFPIVTCTETFDSELQTWFADPTNYSLTYSNRIFPDVAVPMYLAWKQHKSHNNGWIWANDIKAQDWREACLFWLLRRNDHE